MKKTIMHPTYGEIVYEEGIWSGKRTFTINGIAMQKISKDTYVFMIGEESIQAVLQGSMLTGASLNIRGEKIWIISKPKWYDWLLSFLPFAIIMIWGNSASLCSMIPVAGGAIGGALGGAGLVITMFNVREKRGVQKILTALLATLVTFAVGVAMGYAIVFAFMA